MVCLDVQTKRAGGTQKHAAHTRVVGKTGTAAPEEPTCLFPEPLLDSGCRWSRQLILSGIGGGLGAVLLGWARFPWVITTGVDVPDPRDCPQRAIPTRNHIYHLVWNGKHCSFVGTSISNPPSQAGHPTKHYLVPTQADLRLHTTGIWHFGLTFLTWALFQWLDWAVNRTDSAALTERVFQRRAIRQLQVF